MVRSQDNNYATDLESNQIRLKQEDKRALRKGFLPTIMETDYQCEHTKRIFIPTNRVWDGLL